MQGKLNQIFACFMPHNCLETITMVETRSCLISLFLRDPSPNADKRCILANFICTIAMRYKRLCVLIMRFLRPHEKPNQSK